MSEYNIFRPLTDTEKSQIAPLNTATYLEKFLVILANKNAEYSKKRRPFDSYGARLDFENRVRNKISELASAVDKSVISKFEFESLDKYADLKRFKYVGKKVQEVTKHVHGVTAKVIIGNRYKFECKQRGNRLSIFVPTEEEEKFDKWLNEEFLKEPKKKEITKTKLESKE